jgi:E3 Ubiquitin Ligase RBR C-terminal domain
VIFGVCFRAHYIEYLCGLVRDNALDPVIVLSADDLETIVRRAHKRLPPRAYGTPDAKYREALLQVSRAARGERMGARSAHAVISQCFTPRPTFPRSLNFQFGSLHAFYARAPPKLAPPRR